MDSGWYADPLERFEGRFFDGAQWTDKVSIAGQLRIDPEWHRTPAQQSQPAQSQPAQSQEPAEQAPVAAHVVTTNPVLRDPVTKEPLTIREAGTEYGAEERRVGSDRRQIDAKRPGKEDRRKSERRQRKIVIPKA